MILAAPNLYLSGSELGPEVVEMKCGKTFVQFLMDSYVVASWTANL